MPDSPNDALNEKQIEQIVEFDEALRLGRTTASPAAPPDAMVDEAQSFLRRLQSIWRRPAQRIGPYVMIKSLGQGAVGPCYLVEDPNTRQAYALKVLWPDLSAHQQARQLLLKEAATLKLFRHVHAAAVRDARALGTFCYIVSDYCPGPSLAQWRLRHPQPIAWPIVAQLVAKIAEVIEAGHRQGIVHGDLKPTNVFLPGNVTLMHENLHEVPLVVTDFGVAKAIQQARLPAQSGLPWPMPQYLAPEQLSIRHRRAEAASDLYALGVLLYELLTSRSPCRGDTREEIARQTQVKLPSALRQYRSEIPAELDALVLQCLQKDPIRRPASALRLAEALRSVTPPAPVEAQPGWWKQWLGWM